jgi:hypothetical protein
MEYTDLNEKDNFLRYPTNKVVGRVGTPEELHTAILELNKAGFGEIWNIRNFGSIGKSC